MRALLVLIAALLLVGTAAALRAPRATVDRTIVDRNGDNRMELAAGEPRRMLIAFAHFADTQMVDEESPGRVELVDFIGGDPFSSSYRPQEGLMAHVLGDNKLHAIAASRCH